MPTFSKSQLTTIRQTITECRSEVRFSGVWAILSNEYCIGRREGDTLQLTATDRHNILLLVQQLSGLDLNQANLSGSRMDLAAQGASNEKLGNDRPLAKRVICTVVGGDLHYGGDIIAVKNDVEYRIDYRKIDLPAYESILVVENHEPFLRINEMNWTASGPTLVLYRGHDNSATAVNELLASLLPGRTKVIFFTDPDPAGVGIIHDAPAATHALVPDMHFLNEQFRANHITRFADQQGNRPMLLENIKAQTLLAPEYWDYASVICEGLAISQEFLIANNVPLRCIKILKESAC